MQVAKDSVVSIHYTLKDDSGQVLDSSDGRGPLDYIQGASQIIQGLEKALEGKKAGDELSVVIEPEDGYGARDESMVYEVPPSEFEAMEDIQVGMQFRVGTDQGAMIMTVAGVEEDMITLDGNHPLADVRLSFDVSVVSVREATAEEIAAANHEHGAGCGC
ncbi:MAG: peptidylprolyl isomerase [bacterium]|nr:peptidylprolyl isomerase [bacterium]MDT8395454.1 peptidylprolyl isomerase [bacterium]